MTETAKRLREVAAHDPAKVKAGLYSPFRRIGLVSNSVPSSLNSRGGVAFITTCIGKSFHIYDAESLGLRFVSPEAENNITALASCGDLTITASDSGVSIYERARHSHTLFTGSRVSQLLVIGNILVAAESHALLIFDLQETRLLSRIAIERSTITAILHPSTYLNKMLVGLADGSLELWNIHTSKCVYAYDSLGSSVASLAQAPVVDIIAVGLANGQISMLNAKTAAVLFSLEQDSAVTALAFRTDEIPHMASASASGRIAIWNLESRCLEHTLVAHKGLVPFLEFLPNQPLLISTGADNAIREWLFEYGEWRLLKSRSGHAEPISMIRFHGKDGRTLLSTAGNSIHSVSLIKDAQSHELSQGPESSKKDHSPLEKIKSFASFEVKDLKWDNLVTCHLNSPVARTWRSDHKTIGKHRLASSDASIITATTISPCGHFVVTGSSGGRIDSFNLQSGIHRKKIQGHAKTITGLGLDAPARRLVSSSIDGTVKLWDFKAATLSHTYVVGRPVAQLVMHADNDLVALICDDHIVRLFDIETRQLVRELAGHMNRVTDAAFSPDGRWLLTASLDRSIRTWDLASGLEIDLLSCASVPTSLAFSPLSDLLAVSYVGDRAISLFANMSMYSATSIGSLEEAFVMGGISEMNWSQPPQDSACISFSEYPRAKWINLFHIDTIKERTRPQLPSSIPVKAPFFLAEELQALSRVHEQDIVAEPKRHDVASGQSEFIQRLMGLAVKKDYDEFIDYLSQLGASSIDFEIRMLPSDDSYKALKIFLSFLAHQLSTRRNYELIQTYLGIALRSHQNVIIEQADIFAEELALILDPLDKDWSRLEGLFQKSLCLINFCRNI